MVALNAWSLVALAKPIKVLPASSPAAVVRSSVSEHT